MQTLKWLLGGSLMGLMKFIVRSLFGQRKVHRRSRSDRLSTNRSYDHIEPFYRDPFGEASREQALAKQVQSDSVTGKCSVVDGDTIIIAGTNIRLAGIDAPELDHPYGKNAKWALIGLCKGQIIRAEFASAQSYNREVATCYLPDGRDLSAEMVKAGFAIDWAKHSGGKYRSLEVEGIRKKLWRAAARQRGQWPPQPEKDRS
jgi:micrococcal nuclease